MHAVVVCLCITCTRDSYYRFHQSFHMHLLLHVSHTEKNDCHPCMLINPPSKDYYVFGEVCLSGCRKISGLIVLKLGSMDQGRTDYILQQI